MHRSISAELTDRLARAYRQVRIGDPLEPDTLMGPLVNGQEVEEMLDAIAQAQAQGGEIVHRRQRAI